MSDPTTGNIALIIPATGSDVDTWGDVAINPDMVAIDGMLGGVVTVGLSNTNVVLTSPAGSIAPTAGPTQAQNAVVRFTGTLTTNISVVLPLPGFIIIENMTTGPWVVVMRAFGTGEVIGIPQGARMHVFNDGTNVRFVNDVSTFPGAMTFLGGIISQPAWIFFCTVKPYLIADGSIYNFSDYPALGALYVGSFGGNGVTTFGVPDLRGRVPLAYDGTGTRITSAGCGIDGQTLGATGGEQTHTLVTGELAAHAHGVTDPGHVHGFPSPPLVLGGPTPLRSDLANNTITTISDTSSAVTGISINNAGGDGAHNNVQPAQVCGIWLIKT